MLSGEIFSDIVRSICELYYWVITQHTNRHICWSSDLKDTYNSGVMYVLLSATTSHNKYFFGLTDSVCEVNIGQTHENDGFILNSNLLFWEVLFSWEKWVSWEIWFSGKNFSCLQGDMGMIIKVAMQRDDWRGDHLDRWRREAAAGISFLPCAGCKVNLSFDTD